MYRRILAAIDSGVAASRALDEAVAFAGDQEAALRVIHVIDPLPIGWELEGMVNLNELAEAFHKGGAALLQKAVEIAGRGGVTAETALLEAAGRRIAEVIVADADSWQADLVVLGTHGRHGVDRLLMGSVAEEAARTASTPVLLVRGA